MRRVEITFFAWDKSRTTTVKSQKIKIVISLLFTAAVNKKAGKTSCFNAFVIQF